jgi:predicted transcriptional regulator
MDIEEPSYKKLGVPLIIFVTLVSFAVIMPFYSKSEIQLNNPCSDSEDGSWQQEQPQEVNIKNELNCLPDYKKELLKLYILGMINIDELSIWVLGVDRRLIVLKMMHEKRLLQASDIADTTKRSLQNISYAMRELEEHGLIKCLTPDKHTWKKYIPTEKGTKVFEKLKKNHLID